MDPNLLTHKTLTLYVQRYRNMNFRGTGNYMTTQQNQSDIFWAEITPCEHLVQIYGDDDVFVDSLEGFVAGGLKAGDAVIVIATASHRSCLESRLITNGISLSIARSRDQYITLDTEETLTKFLVNDWPDEELFEQLVIPLIERARRTDRRVRAFGELVAVMWGQGLNGATVQLEHLWHKLCQRESFSLFCAYPKTGFTQDAQASIREICQTHSRIVPDALPCISSVVTDYRVINLTPSTFHYFSAPVVR